jgi:signal transduction histidine kinase
MRVTDEVEVQLLIHHETSSPVTKGAATAALRHAIEESAQFVQSTEEQRQVAGLREAVDAYLEPSAGDAQLVATLAAARRLSLLNVEQSRQALERAALWDRLSNIGGVSAAIVLLVGVAGLLVWLRHGPFRAIAGLSQAMGRFSDGDLDSRAPEVGPRELAIMARSFNATAEALMRARARQTEYLATAIHDLRTPLTAIQLAVGYIAPDRPLPPESRIRGLIELIGRQLTRLNGLVGDVLNASWIESGKLPLLRERFDARPIVAESVQLFRTLAPEHLIDLTMPSEPIMLQADRARIQQVLNNLLSNAVKYSPLGSRVRVNLACTGEQFTLTVSDEGQGIAPKDHAQIFETFQRTSATHGEAPGTSLGLWVSRRVIEAHGGRLELRSRVGHGSTFCVVLPAESLHTDAVAESASRDAA